MASTFHGLELGKRGLAVAQTSISTTGHNIANANTKGYSRQQVNLAASQSLDIWTSGSVNPGQLGQGALVESITRVRDRFLDAQYRGQSATAGEWSVRQETLGRIESVINEPSDTGMRAALNQLDAAMQDLSNDPSSTSAQVVLKERVMAFVDLATSIGTSLQNIAEDLRSQHGAAITEVNGYLQQITDLNKSILQNGRNSNDLLDKRDLIVEKLALLVSIDVKEDKNGSYNINLVGGKVLVTGTEYEKLMPYDATTGGKITGINESLKALENDKEKLVTFLKGFALANGLNGTEDLSASGISFAIQKMISNKTSTDWKNAIETAQSSLRTFVSELGAKSQSAMNAVANSEAALLATENRRQSVTGISIDEEMANLIKYQHSYSAAARFVSTTDQMLDTIINRMAR